MYRLRKGQRWYQRQASARSHDEADDQRDRCQHLKIDDCLESDAADPWARVPMSDRAEDRAQ